MESGLFTRQLPQLTGQVLEMELQKSNQLINQFVYSCSHSLRSPIKSMAGLVSLIKKVPAENTVDQQLYIKLLTDSIFKAHAIRSQFEEFAKISKENPKIEMIPLRPFFKKILKHFEDRFIASNISVSFHIEQKGKFYSNRRGLRIVLLQLLSNAIEFQKGEGKENAITLFVTASEYSCSIQVHDKGIGIPETAKDKIFNLFYRGSEKSKGAGIGLYIAKEITEKMGGTLAFQSSEEGGTVFSLWLPDGAPFNRHRSDDSISK